MPRARLFVCRGDEPFHRALSKGAIARGATPRPVLVPVMGAKEPMRFRKRDLRAILISLARSPDVLRAISPDSVPPLLRRLAASGAGPREYFADGSLIERAFGLTLPPRPVVDRAAEGAIAWEASQPHRAPRRPLTGDILPPQPPRDLTSWRASVATYCLAEATARAIKKPPCVTYFFFRDWLMDQTKASETDPALRTAGSRLLSWICGGDDAELDACAARAPAPPPSRDDERAIARVIRIDCCHERPALYPAHPPTVDHAGRATCWMSVVRRIDEPHAILRFDRAKVDPLDLWRALKRIERPGDERSRDLIFDDRRVYLYVTQAFWRSAVLERLPLLLARGGSSALRFGTNRVPLAPFFAAAYASGRASGVEIAVRGLYAMLFRELPGEIDARLIPLLPQILNRYPDVVGAMRSAYRTDLADGAFEIDSPGFFSALCTLATPKDLRGISLEGCRRIGAISLRVKLLANLRSDPTAPIAEMSDLSDGQAYHLYALAEPAVFESLASLSPGSVVRPAKRVAIRFGPARTVVAIDLEPELDQFARALYEAERLSTVPIADRGAPDAPETEPDFSDQAAMWDREIAPDLPAKRAFLAAAIAPIPFGIDDPYFSAHEDAEACLTVHPVEHVRLAALCETEEDMDSADLRHPCVDSPVVRALESVLDDRSEGRTRGYGEAWRAISRFRSDY